MPDHDAWWTSVLERTGRPVLVASHERSGTHLMIDLLRKQFPACRPRMLPLEPEYRAYLSLDRFFPGRKLGITERGALALLRKAERPTLKSHAFPDLHEIRDDARDFARAVVDRSDVLYCVRDGRDTLCSMYIWMQGFTDLASVSFGEWLRQTDEHGRSRPGRWAAHALSWMDRPGVKTVMYSRVVKDTEACLRELGEHLGAEPAMVDPLLPVPVRTKGRKRLARLTGRYESTNMTARGRPTPKRWELFEPADHDLFVEEAGHVMERLGLDTSEASMRSPAGGRDAA